MLTFNPFAWLLVLFFIGTPIVLTIINIIFLFYKKGNYTRFLNVSDGFTLVLGVSFTALLFSMGDFPEWSESLIRDGTSFFYFHTPIAHEFFITFLAFSSIAFCGHAILRIKKDNLPPIIATLCISGIFIGIILCIVWGIQVYKNIKDDYIILFLLFPLNYILCSLRLLREVLSIYAKKAI